MKLLSENIKAEIRSVPDSWIEFYGLDGMVERFGYSKKTIIELRKKNGRKI